MSHWVHSELLAAQWITGCTVVTGCKVSHWMHSELHVLWDVSQVLTESLKRYLVTRSTCFTCRGERTFKSLFSGESLTTYISVYWMHSESLDAHALHALHAVRYPLDSELDQCPLSCTVTYMYWVHSESVDAQWVTGCTVSHWMYSESLDVQWVTGCTVSHWVYSESLDVQWVTGCTVSHWVHSEFLDAHWVIHWQKILAGNFKPTQRFSELRCA